MTVGVVLAGGAARRMGGTKPTADLAGRPLISYPLAALSGAGLPTAIVSRAGVELPDLAVPVWQEPADAPRHPATGLIEALQRSGGEPVVVLACDTPFVDPELITELVARPEPLACAATADGVEPLIARYDATALPALVEIQRTGAPLRAGIAALDPGTVAVDPVVTFNVNVPDDLRRAHEPLAPPFTGRTVADAMLSDPRISPPDLTVEEAREAFGDDHVHALLLIRGDGQLLSVVERGDLDSGGRGAQLGTLIGRTVTADANLDEVWRRVRREGRRRLAVIDADGHLRGLLAVKRSGLGFCSNAGVAARRADQLARDVSER